MKMATPTKIENMIAILPVFVCSMAFIKFQRECKITTTRMDDIVICEDSGDSIIEIELPKKPSPPVILVEDEEIVLNVAQKKSGPVLAEEFIKKNQLVPDMAEIHSRTGTSTNVNSPNHWTKDMIKFYDDDWGDEDQFIVEKLQEKMDKSPFLWDISRKDFLSMRNKLRRSNVRCWNCRQRGHHFSMCPDPPRVPKCHMCGVQGHLEHCCPDSKCLNCGNPSGEYVTCCYKCSRRTYEICSRCQLIGHDYVNCSDHWRLFHLTTHTTSVIIPEKNIYKLDKDMWCCNCGKRGHYQTNCIQSKDCNGFTDTLPFVVSYQSAFSGNNGTQRSKESWGKKNKDRRREETKMENILKVNPLNKALRKAKKLKKRQKRIRSKNKRRKNELLAIM